MKKYLFFLFFFVFLLGCSDGDIAFDKINFDSVSVNSCENGILYKLNEKESLILNIPLKKFTNETSYDSLVIGGSNQFLYRFYNGKVTSDNICKSIQPVTPIVTDQWTAKDGIVIINTVAVKKLTDENKPYANGTRIVGYNHAIALKNVTFSKNDGGTIIYQSFSFGDYRVNLPNNYYKFDFSSKLDKCSKTGEIYNSNISESLNLIIDSTLIVNKVTPINEPRVGLIGKTKNKLYYRLYNGILGDSYFCNDTNSSNPIIIEEWIADAGEEVKSGIIEVTTTTLGTSYKHTIVLKKVKFLKGKDDFLLGDSFLLGDLITTD